MARTKLTLHLQIHEEQSNAVLSVGPLLEKASLRRKLTGLLLYPINPMPKLISPTIQTTPRHCLIMYIFLQYRAFIILTNHFLKSNAKAMIVPQIGSVEEKGGWLWEWIGAYLYCYWRSNDRVRGMWQGREQCTLWFWRGLSSKSVGYFVWGRWHPLLCQWETWRWSGMLAPCRRNSLLSLLFSVWLNLVLLSTTVLISSNDLDT